VNDLFKVKLVKAKEENGNTLYKVKDFENGQLKTKEISLQEYQNISLVNESREHIEIQFSACRHLVGSFQHSEPLQKELKQLQKDLKQEYKIKLIQDCKTRWNYTHDMVESILLNEMPLKTMKLKYEKLTVPDNMELLSEVIDLLQPLKEVTVLFSTSDFVSISFLFPAIFNLIEYTVPGFDFKFSHTKILKEELLRTIKGRFDYINQDQNVFIKVAAFLDFRYKKFHFIHDETLRNEQLSLVKKFLIEFDQKLYSKSTETSTNSQNDSNTNNNNTQPGLRDTTNVIRRKRKITNFMDSLCDKLPVLPQNNAISEIDIEIEAYESHMFSIRLANKDELKRHRSLLFFKLYHKQFPKLTRIVRFTIPFLLRQFLVRVYLVVKA
jgi:hypothetical protein